MSVFTTTDCDDDTRALTRVGDDSLLLEDMSSALSFDPATTIAADCSGES